VVEIAERFDLNAAARGRGRRRLRTAPLPAGLSTLRVVEVLELIGTPEARELIELVAQCAPTPAVAEDARVALDRLGRLRGSR
jgi:hypothetical protein